jgi:hypothetical protein
MPINKNLSTSIPVVKVQSKTQLDMAYKLLESSLFLARSSLSLADSAEPEIETFKNL